MGKTKHKNKEKVVKCPVRECEYEGLARGIHLHVRQSTAPWHGPNGDVPDNVSLDNLEVVGEKEVKMNYPDKQETDTTARLCPYCGRAFRGYRAVKIHLGQKKGQGVHPDDATEVTKEDTPVAHVDEDMNVIEVVDSAAMMPSTKRRIEEGEDTIDVEEVEKFVAELKNRGKDDVADLVQNALLS